jgi:hypothetical protein
MVDTDYIEITVVLDSKFPEVAKLIAGAMADAAVEASGRAHHLAQIGDSRKDDATEAAFALVAIATRLSDAVERLTSESK